MSKHTIKLDRERKLALDFNAITFLDEVGGINFLEGTIKLAMFKKPAKMLLLITACLQTDAIDNGEELTTKQVGKLLDLQKMVEFSETMASLVEDSLPEAEEAGEVEESPTEASPAD